jgi:hypothetical protein
MPISQTLTLKNLTVNDIEQFVVYQRPEITSTGPTGDVELVVDVKFNYKNDADGNRVLNTRNSAQIIIAQGSAAFIDQVAVLEDHMVPWLNTLDPILISTST